MLLYAGMDWTSSQKSDRDIRAVAIAATNDLEKLELACQQTRTALGLHQDHFFHAYEDTPEIQLVLLKSILTIGITIRIGAIIYDSADGVLDIAAQLSDRDFQHYIGIRLLREFVPLYPLRKLQPDNDLKGDKQENRFKKDVRELRDVGYFHHAPEISFPKPRKGIKKSGLIQFADLIVYNLYRNQRNALVLPEMQKLIKGICKDSNNVIRKLGELEVQR